MNIKSSFNKHIFSQIGADSGALTTLASVVHTFSEIGQYTGIIRREKDIVGGFNITVIDSNADIQAEQHITIDLSGLSMPFSQFKKASESKDFMLKVSGSATFAVSGDTGGYSVELQKITKEGVSDKIFDSCELKGEDHFISIILRPGTYSITNLTSKVKGELTVDYPEVGNFPTSPEPVMIESDKDSFKPNKVQIKPTQILIFSFKVTSRIKIELIKPNDKKVTAVEPNKPQQKEKQVRNIRRHLQISPRIQILEKKMDEENKE